jgi:hypothetical protein
MKSERPITKELMRLYENQPDLVLYKDDLLRTEQTRYIEEIARTNNGENLNPIDVVLESLINVLSEKSISDSTHPVSTVYVDSVFQETAVQKIMGFAKEDATFLKDMHKEWLEGLRSFLSALQEKGVETLQEAVFQVSLRFRISAKSSLKAMSSLFQS